MGVDESTALAWSVCPLCDSDQLTGDSTTTYDHTRTSSSSSAVYCSLVRGHT